MIRVRMVGRVRKPEQRDWQNTYSEIWYFVCEVYRPTGIVDVRSYATAHVARADGINTFMAGNVCVRASSRNKN